MDTELYALIGAIKSDSGLGVRTAITAKPELLSAACDELNRSPLHLAARMNRPAIAESLLRAGADFYALDANGQLALDVPPGEMLNDCRQLLRSINAARIPFLEAVHQQQLGSAKMMLTQDPTLANTRDVGDGWSPLMIACFHGNAELVQAILHAGSRLDHADFHTGLDAGYFCAERGTGRCMELLLQAGFDPEHFWHVPYGRLPMEMNALHVASWKGKADIVEVLLEAGVDPNERAKSYAVFSPLHFAASEGHTEIVQLLLSHRADASACDGRRVITALEMAEQGRHTETAEVLGAMLLATHE